MKEEKKVVNHFLVDVFNEILKTEEYCIASSDFNLSLKEIHVIEATCKMEDEGADTRSTAIAAALRITPGTLTTAVNLLEKKGYLLRKRDDRDKRIVRIYTTELGRKAQDQHEVFHQEMVEHILGSLTEEEAEVFTRSLKKLAAFFRDKYYATQK